MSAIFGLVRFDGGEISREDLSRQMAALEHRGRDSAGMWRDGSIGLGRRLMRITREDIHDRQPFHGEGFTLVADARLDNREELADKLGVGTAELAAVADSTLLAAAWRRWGADCVEHLVGDFAFAVWDDVSRQLTLVRDHMGQRQVFYHKGEDFFAFATENRGLFALRAVPRELDADAVVLRTAMFEDGAMHEPGSTVHKGIRALVGGTLLTVDALGEVTERRYWEPLADPAHLNRDAAYYVETYRRILTEAVACRVRRATAPAAVFLSGGFDSASIAALGAQVAAEREQKFIAVSSVMPEDYKGLIRHAREWVAVLDRHVPNLTVRYVTGEDIDLLEGMDAEFVSYNDPHTPSRAINNALLREAAKASARVVMDGHGGDYTLNPPGIGYLARLLRQGRLLRFVREFRAGRRHLGLSRWRMTKQHVLWQLLPLPLRQLYRRRRMGLPLRGLLTPLAEPVLARCKPTTRRRRKLYHVPEDNALLFLRLQAGQAMGTAIPAAAHGLEFTQPFHDKRVVELGLAIPEKFQARNGQVRVLAKAALAEVLPPQFRDRRPSNDPLEPDFAAVVGRVRSRVLAELDRMEAGGHLAEFFDFAKMRAGISREMRDGNGEDQMPVRKALLAFIAARYIQWYRGDNA